MQFQIADRIQFEQRQQSDRITRLEARLDKLCNQMNQFCAEVRTALAGMGGTIAEPSAPLGGAQSPSDPMGPQPSVPMGTQPSGDNVSPHPSVEIPELDITRGLTAGPLRKQ